MNGNDERRERRGNDWTFRPMEITGCFGRPPIPEYGTNERLLFDVDKLVRLALEDLPTEYYTMNFLYVMIPFVRPDMEGPEYYKRTVAMFARNVVNLVIDEINNSQFMPDV